MRDKWAPRRRAVRREGHHRHRRHADGARLADLQRPSAAARRGMRGNLLRKAGGVLMGKTVTTEFANVHPGKTRNPWILNARPEDRPADQRPRSPHRWCRSRSALRRPDRPRVRRPSAARSTSPTWGDLRTNGVMEASGSLDTLGILARSVEDVALYRDVLLGVAHEPVRDLASPPRIGFCRTHVWPRLKPETQKLLEDSARTPARSGAHVEEVTLPVDFEALEDASMDLGLRDGAQSHVGIRASLERDQRDLPQWAREGWARMHA